MTIRFRPLTDSKYRPALDAHAKVVFRDNSTMEFDSDLNPKKLDMEAQWLVLHAENTDHFIHAVEVKRIEITKYAS